MKKYKPYLTRVDLVKNQVERERIQEQEAAKKRKQRIQEQNRQRHLRYQEQLRSELAARYFHGVVSAGGESFSNKYSVLMDGSDESVGLGNDTSRKVQTLTMSVWAKPTANARDGIFLNGHTSYGNQGIEIYWNFNQFRVRINGTTYGLGAGNGQNNWSHVIISYDGNTLKRMTNGVLLADVVVGASINYTNYNGLRIGRSPYGYHIGNIDEVAFWDSDQSANYSTIYNEGVPGDLSNLSPSSWYRMGDNDGGTGITVTDQGSAGINGTLINDTSFVEDTPS